HRRIVRFFFQAEDGIRDFHVTGVQTCALPILSPGTDPKNAAANRNSTSQFFKRVSVLAWTSRTAPSQPHADDPATTTKTTTTTRSEERRVGKEGRAGWSARSSRISRN